MKLSKQSFKIWKASQSIRVCGSVHTSMFLQVYVQTQNAAWNTVIGIHLNSAPTCEYCQTMLGSSSVPSILPRLEEAMPGSELVTDYDWGALQPWTRGTLSRLALLYYQLDMPSARSQHIYQLLSEAEVHISCQRLWSANRGTICMSSIRLLDRDLTILLQQASAFGGYIHDIRLYISTCL